MNKTIRKAAVIGSGIMGSGIAAHLANVGIPCLLLDVTPAQLTAEEAAKGLTLHHPAVRNRLAAAAIAKLKKTNPAPLYDEAFADRITPGNLDDHLALIGEVDWVIEVVVENLQVKRELLSRVERYWKSGTIVSSNTSGISIDAMSAHCGEAFRQHFMGTHFFNPPRYMKLLEIVPGRDTSPELVSRMKAFCEQKLGKGVVLAKDTPNFVANRIGTYGLLATLREMEAGGFTVEEIDAVTGPAIGRPKSATFRTLDLVGIDTFVHVADNVYDNVADEAERAAFSASLALKSLVEKGWLGEKSGQGFYRKSKGPSGKSEIASLDLTEMTYSPQRKVTSGSLEAAKLAKGAREKVKALLAGGDRYSELAWSLLKQVLVYSAEKVGEIADTPDQPTGDAGSASGPPRDLPSSLRRDLDIEDLRATTDDPNQLTRGVVVETDMDAEPVPQRRRKQAGSGGRRDQGESREVDAHRAGRRTLADEKIKVVILQSRVKDLDEGHRYAVDLVEEECVPRFKAGQQRREVACLGNGRTGRRPQVGSHLSCNDLRKCRLPQPWRPREKNVIEEVSARLRCVDEDRQVRAGFGLAVEVGEPLRPQLDFVRVGSVGHQLLLTTTSLG